MKRIFTAILLFAFFIAEAKPTVAPVSLTCNDMTDPICVSNVKFSWKLSSSVDAACQTAHEIWLGTTPGCNGNVWKSGKVVSDDQLDIALPEGVVLQDGRL